MEWYYLWAVLLILASGVAWLSNFFLIPGNWLILLMGIVFALVRPAEGDPLENGHGIGWITVGILAGLALFGEIVEFVAGAAGAAKRRGSRRGMALAIVGSIVGSIGGAMIGVPVPLVGPLIGALAGGGVGAFAGAYAGETWKGRTSEESLDISRAAAVGRILGTVGKIAVGAVMVIVLAVDAFF